MKYRIIDNGRTGYNVQVRHLFIWFTCRSQEHDDYPTLVFGTVEEAEKYIEKDAAYNFNERRARHAAKKKRKIVKVIGYSSKDEVIMKLQGK